MEVIIKIRKAEKEDLSRIAEIYVFNNRINFYPIFKDANFSFGELQIVSMIDNYFKSEDILCHIYVFDDVFVKECVQMNEAEICKLYVDPCLQNEGIGHQLIEYVKEEMGANRPWTLKKMLKQFLFIIGMVFD